MVYTPNLLSVNIEALFSYDTCNHFVKNLSFTNTCDTFASPNNNRCCEDLIIDLFGDMKVGKCYTNTNFRNYTHVQFECSPFNSGSSKLDNYLGLLLLLSGIFCIIYGIMKCTDESNTQPKELTPKEDEYRLTQLNNGFNIQSGKYQTFEEHK